MRERTQLFAILVGVTLALVFLLAQGRSATTFSSGYLINTAGSASATDFLVTASGESVPVRLYFSDASLSKYFALYSSHPDWDGAGFSGLSGTARFTLEADGITDESLFFRNHTVWVEVGGENHTLAFFIIPGTFLVRGRPPPGEVGTASSIRQAVMERDGMKLPVEVDVKVW